MGRLHWHSRVQETHNTSQEKRVLKEPEILINQNAQDMVVCARIRPFKSIRDLRGHLIEPYIMHKNAEAQDKLNE